VWRDFLDRGSSLKSELKIAGLGEDDGNFCMIRNTDAVLIGKKYEDIEKYFHKFIQRKYAD
jgi:hypothetical protein